MYAKTQQQPTPMCTFCKSIGKSEREYTSHFIHKTKSLSSRITCPELLKRVCLNCPGNTHTSDRCTRMNTVQVCFSSEKNSSNKKSSSAEKKETKNRFAGLEDDSDDEEKDCNEQFIDLEMGIPRESFVSQPLPSRKEDHVIELPSRVQITNMVGLIVKMDNHADQINYIGEEIYAHVAVRDPQRAGKITGMILELDDITELLYMLETPELFNSMIADCVRVIEQPV